MEKLFTYYDIKNKFLQLEEENMQKNNEDYYNLDEKQLVEFQKSFFDTLTSGVVIFSDNQIEYANIAALKMIGVANGDVLLGKSPLEFISPEFVEIAKERINLLMNGTKLLPIEIKFKRVDNGEKIDVFVSSSIFNSNNKVHFLIVLNDISEKNKIEKELQKNIYRLNSLFNIDDKAFDTEKEYFIFMVDEIQKISQSEFCFFTKVESNIVDLQNILCSEHCRAQNEIVRELIENENISNFLYKCLEQKKPIINNKYNETENSLTLTSNFMINRFLLIPFIEKNIVKGIIGVANKKNFYEEEDIAHLTIYLKSFWAKIINYRTEQVLRKSENKYRNIIEKANDGVLIISNKQILFANEKITNLTEYKIEELIGKDYSKVFSKTTTKDILKNVTSILNDFLSSIVFNAELVTKSNDKIETEINLSLIEFESKDALLLFIRDIRERNQKDIENKMLFGAIDFSPTAIIITDIKGRVEYVNNKFFELSGYSREEVFGKDLINLIFIDKGANIIDTIKNNLQTKGIWSGEIQNRKKTGEIYWDLSTISTIKDNKGRVIKYIIAKEDITGIKNKEQELIQRNLNLKLLNDFHLCLLDSETEDQLLFAFCDIAVTTLGFELAIVGSIISDNGEYHLLSEANSFKEISNIFHITKNIKLQNDCELIKSFNENSTRPCDLRNRCSNCNIIPKDLEYELLLSVPIVVDEHTKKCLLLFKKIYEDIDDFKYHLIFELINYISFGVNIMKERIEKQKYQERHLIEKNLLNVTLNSIADAVITVDKEGLVSYINYSAINLLDSKEADLLGKKIFDIINLYDSNDQKVFYNPFDSIEEKQENKDVIKSRYSLVNFTNHRKKVNISSAKILDEKGLFIGVVIVLRDITRIVKIETQAALSQKMESVGQLAAGIAHEINTPMQFVGDNTYFIKESFETVFSFIDKTINSFNSNYSIEKIIEYFRDNFEEHEIDYYKNEIPIAIDRTIDGIDRVRKIVIAMKNFAYSSGKQKAQSNINQGIDVTVTISKNEWKYVADLITELDNELPPVYCSLDEINQVILNMIINAAHAIAEKKSITKEFEGTIKIRTYKDSTNAYIEINDNGAGIPADKINRIFDPFYTTKEVGKGTGQGLTIAHDIIVNKHHGAIDVESETGIGTKFIISLPINGE